MRLARVLTRLNLGGPARQVLASDPLLVARGHRVRIFAGTCEPGEGDLFGELVAAGLDVVRVEELRRGISPARDLAARRRLRAGLEEFAPDLIHTHASKAGTLGRSVLAGLPGAARVGRVHTFHGHVLRGYFPEWISRALRRHEARLARRTDRVVAVSHATAEELVELGVAEQERIVVIPPGIDLRGFTQLAELGSPQRRSGALRDGIAAGPDDLVVGVVGRLAQVKRTDRALDVFELLAERYPRLHLAFVGDGPQRKQIERRVASLSGGGAGRVHLVGARVDMPQVLADLDVVLLTSRSEGMPVALIEAGAAGLPVVARAVGGVAEVVEHERSGLLGDTTEELARQLASLLDHPAERAALGLRGRLRVQERHSAEALTDRLEELYEAVLRSRRAPAEALGH